MSLMSFTEALFCVDGEVQISSLLVYPNFKKETFYTQLQQPEEENNLSQSLSISSFHLSAKVQSLQL